MTISFDTDACQTSVFGAVLRARRQYGSARIILEDADGQTLTYQRLALASLVLAGALRRLSQPDETIGILLPNATGLVATFLALNACGRTAALLNFTAGPRNLRAAIAIGQIRTVLTSRRFIEAAKLGDVIDALRDVHTQDGKPLRFVYLEDVRATLSTWDKCCGWLACQTATLTGGSRRQEAGRIAALLFTSGTEGTPKGVALTNANLVANASQVMALGGSFLSQGDIWMNPLPLFHSFGLTAGTLVPLLNGMKSVLHPSPLQYRQVAAQIRKTKATILLATDTFAQGYARAASPGDLDSLRIVVAGAERVKPKTRALYASSGTLLLEGYGATECGPVIAVNLPDSTMPDSVGPLLPGIEAHLEPVEGITEGGRLMVRGPNVMAGYMRIEAPGVIQPPPGGWHDTGDIVTIDEGYLTIRGRAKRFAKIGGEMVSLAAIEEVAVELWPTAHSVVVSVADPRKGEQLVMITDTPEASRDAMLGAVRSRGWPELWAPRSIECVDAIPLLGSGKVDLPATQELLRHLNQERTAAKGADRDQPPPG